MTLLSKTAQIRDNIRAAILALPDWPADVPVEKLLIPTDAFHRGHRMMVGVCLTEDSWQNLDLALNDFIDHEAMMEMTLVIYSTSESGGDSTTGALEPDDGRIDGLLGILLGSHAPGYGSGLRNVDVGIPGVTGSMHFRAVKTQLMADERRAQGVSGGAVAKLLFMRSTSFAL